MSNNKNISTTVVLRGITGDTKALYTKVARDPKKPEKKSYYIAFKVKKGTEAESALKKTIIGVLKKAKLSKKKMQELFERHVKDGDQSDYRTESGDNPNEGFYTIFPSNQFEFPKYRYVSGKAEQDDVPGAISWGDDVLVSVKVSYGFPQTGQQEYVTFYMEAIQLLRSNPNRGRDTAQIEAAFEKAAKEFDDLEENEEVEELEEEKPKKKKRKSKKVSKEKEEEEEDDDDDELPF